MTRTAPARGQITTFYSYKGGTGRSMALANVACLLARAADRNRPVLMIDWDLEAPGLHGYFRGLIGSQDQPAQERERRSARKGASESVHRLDKRPGLIDLFEHLAALVQRRSGPRSLDLEAVRDLVREADVMRYITPTTVSSLHLACAGRFDDEYSGRVNRFDWEALFARCPDLFSVFAEHLAERFDHILIDSRTGYTDIGGVCTALMPDAIVAVFTANRQSVDGLLQIVRSATEHRRRSEDPRPLIVFPLPSRIETAEDNLRKKWRHGDDREGIPGYQRVFEETFRQIYDLQRCEMGPYFDDVQIQHVPRFAYGEEIAVLLEQESERLSLTRAYEAFVAWLVNATAPWEKPRAEAEKLRESVSRVSRTLQRQAQRSFEEGDFEAAAELFQEIVATQREEVGSGRGDTANFIANLQALAEARFRLHRLDEALRLAREIREHALRVGDKEGVRVASRIASKTLLEAGRIEDARREVVKRLDQLGMGEQERIESLLELALIQRHFGQLSATLTTLDEAGVLAEKMGNTRAIAHVAARRSEIFTQRGELHSAAQVLEDALPPVASEGDPEVVVNLLEGLGKARLALGDLRSAETSYQSALEIVQRENAPAHPAVAQVLMNLGGVYAQAGRYEEARRTYERALSVYERSLGPEHPEVGVALYRLGGIQRALGDLDAARDAYERSLAISERLAAAEPERADYQRDLAVAFGRIGDLQRSPEIQSKVYGMDDHPEVAASLHELAGVLQAQGDLAGAQQRLERALEIQERVYGTDDHPEVAASLHALAGVLLAQGDLAGAQQRLERALEIQERVYGTDDHPEVAASLHALAGVLQARGDLAGAQQRLERALEIQERVYGTEEHPSVAASLHSLAGVLQAQGDLAGARQRLERALEIQERVYGTEEHPSVAASLHSLAGVLQAQGDLAGARQRLERALEIQERVYGTEEHPSVAASLHSLAGVLQAQGDLAGARQRLERVLEIEATVYGTRDHYSTAITEVALGSLLVKLGGEEKQAAELLAHAYRVFQAQLGPDHPYTRQLADLFTPRP